VASGSAFWMGRLVRYKEGRFSRFPNGLTKGGISVLYADRSGRIWFGDERGLTRIDDPGAVQPVFVHDGTDREWSGSSVESITEDLWGRIYVASERGVDRLDPGTGHIRRYTTADGLVKGLINLAYRDKQGTLWFGSRNGISRFVPELDSAPSPTEVRIIGLRIRGIAHSISDLGETAVSGPALASNQNQVQIDFNGLGLTSGDLRYQYMLEGADLNWSPPTDQRTVNYASLSSGSYRFLVRAVTARGTPNSPPAVVAFRILPPLWLRWWSMVLEAIAMTAAIYTLHRYRLRSALELQHIRMGIATDLHDDIGASLSQIALLSEVVGRQIERDWQVLEPLEQIGGISRQLVDSMSDIVWAINPKRDTLADLTRRMRSFSGDVFPARHVAFRFRAPEGGQDLQLGIEARRQVYLIFKESVNNIVRHAEASEAEIDFRVEQDSLVLKVNDNGKGFEPQNGSAGHGLASMSDRARRLSGDFQVSSGAKGTTVSLRIPIGGRRSGRWWGKHRGAGRGAD
jgi:signal transduction histidine kinase